MHPQEILTECFDPVEEDYYEWVSKEDFKRLRFLDQKNLNNDCSESELEELENLNSRIMRNSLNAFKVRKRRIKRSGLTWSDFYKSLTKKRYPKASFLSIENFRVSEIFNKGLFLRIGH